MELVETHFPLTANRAKKIVEEMVEELKELNWLYTTQKERINIGYSKEKAIGMLFRTTAFEFETALHLLDKIVRIKQEVGLYRRNLGTLELTGNLEETIRGLDANNAKDQTAIKVMSDPEKRRRVLDVIRRLRNLPPQAVDKLIGLKIMDGEFKDIKPDQPS